MNTIVSDDRGWLQQIVNNLLGNAFKFTEKGNIHLNAEYGNGELRFWVQDTGSGMSEPETKKYSRLLQDLEMLVIYLDSDLG